MKKRRNVTMVVNDPDLAAALGRPAPDPTPTEGPAVNWLLDGNKPFGMPIYYKKPGGLIPTSCFEAEGRLTIIKGPSTPRTPTDGRKNECDILVASGESSLIGQLNLLKTKGLLAETTHICQSPLICGDIAIVERNTREMVWIGERKEKKDFVASIIDGRHRTQQAVMLEQNFKRGRICYIIEGNPLRVKRAVNQKAIVGALIYPIIRYGFNTIMVDNVAETALLVSAIHNQLECAEEDKFTAREKIDIANTLNKGPKKADLCERDRFPIILTRVPDVSDDIADGIAAVYGSFPQMIAAFRAQNEPTLLENIPVKGKSEKRRVGPAASRKIYEYFGVAEILAGERPLKKQRGAEDDDP
jgi:ERCC4-type nuclease